MDSETIALMGYNFRLLISINNDAGRFALEGKYAEATPLAERSVSLAKVWGEDDVFTLTVLLHNLAWLYEVQDRYTDAELLYKQIAALFEQVWGNPNNVDVLKSLNSLARLFVKLGKYSDAEQIYKRITAPFGQDKLFLEDPLGMISGLAEVYRRQRRYIEALELYESDSRTLEFALGPERMATAHYRR